MPGPAGQPWIAAVVLGLRFMRLMPFETVLWHVLQVTRPRLSSETDILLETVEVSPGKSRRIKMARLGGRRS